MLELGANVAELNAQNKLAGELAATRLIARLIAGLRPDAVGADDLRDEDEADATASTATVAKADLGELFDATATYGLVFSSEDEQRNKSIQ